MMDITGNFPGDSNLSGNRDHHYLRQLNKLSHKISKPTASTVPISSAVKRHGFGLAPPLPATTTPAFDQGNLHQRQPPVYNINKNEFRDVVQRLTGSPALKDISAPSLLPQPMYQPKPQSSRLQRIRPPPLAHLTDRPISVLNGALLNPNFNSEIPMNGAATTAGEFIPRTTAPLSPLPPLPPVHAAAESPVSAYMRYRQSSMSAIDFNQKLFAGFSPLVPLGSPRLYQQQENAPPALPQSSSGCLNSPKSPYGLLSPSILLSPTSGQIRLPLSPTRVPIPSP